MVTLKSKLIELSIMTFRSETMSDKKETGAPVNGGHAGAQWPGQGAMEVGGAHAVGGASPGEGDRREPRGARRKRETRARLLEAALALVATKGFEYVTINEITEAADVGFGSFYNHFESKDALHAALVDWVIEEFGDRLDALVSGLSDPAEVIAVCVRHTLLRARREPVWGRFLIREGFSDRALHFGMHRRLRRDSEMGIAAGRFAAADPFMSHVSVTGIVLAAIAAELNVAAPGRSPADRDQDRDVAQEQLAERTAVAVLQTLGLDRAEAKRVALRPLPVAPR
ncbi:TetR family transcriptional regulator [Burkholderia cenocepacia]|uniref:TetR family transcriptional regulator n=2 Tax=Burkholderia TaxID=32008 RepID=A0A6J5JVA7_9BURK|nr:TetR family transcriptional regulator [Burkholderia cenocepacia]